MSKDSLLNFINHYKKSIEKNADNEERVLHCLQRLTKLRMDVNILQQTGIGKTVANSRKLDGEAGKLARKLLHKWKEIVSNHENENVEKKLSSVKKSEPLFKLPVKLAPEEKSEIEMALEKLSSDEGGEVKKIEKKPDKHRHHSSSSSSSRSHHHHQHSSSHKHHSSSKEKDKERSKNSSTSSSQHKSSHHHNNNHSSHNSSSKRKRDEHSSESKDSKEKTHHKKPRIDSDKHKENNKSKHEIENNSKKHTKELKEKSKTEELDGSVGLGFAEALAMFDMPSSSKKKDVILADKITTTISSKKSSSSSSKDYKKSSSSSSSDKDKPSTSTSSKLKELKAPPKLLVEMPAKLEPLPDIVKELPSDLTIPEYRPSLLTSAVKDYINSSIQGTSSTSLSRHQPTKTSAEVMTESFSSKVNRTRVFSGNRVNKAIPTLFELNIRVLQEHIDFITETGGVPFDILRPVLEKAKPEQLATIEYYNPYLLEESDVLWEPHVKRKFRTRKREELESWREMYERCTREDEEKLSRLTKNIKKHQEIADSGIQKTRLAFVDSLVKPPRNVMRKQEIFGTSSKLVSSPVARTEGLKHLAPNVVLAGDVRLRVAAGLRDDAQVNRTASRPIKKAPMMAKVLSKFRR